MTKTFTSSPRALMAIAAVLAAVSNPALSQDMSVPTGADPAPVAAPDPAPIVIPPVQPAPTMTSAPVVQAVPAAPVIEPSAAATSAAPNNRRASPSAAAKPVRAGSNRVETAAPLAASVGIPVAVAGPPVSQAAAPALPVGPVPVAASLQPAAANDSMLSSAALAGIGLGGLALVGLLGAGALRRRRQLDGSFEALPEPNPVAAAPPPARTPVSEPLPEPAVRYAFASSAAPATAALFGTQPAPANRPQIPVGPLRTGAAMVTLFNGLVAAAPDAENPFVGVKRRGRRVRWLLRQHEYRLREPQDQGFDFRSFTPSPQPNRELVNA